MPLTAGEVVLIVANAERSEWQIVTQKELLK